MEWFCGAACITQDDPTAAASDGRLLWGFQQVHDVFGRYPVPTGHSQCCRVCVDMNEAPRPAQPCESLNNCNGHGVCMFGACQCTGDWSGEACTDPPSHAARFSEHWSTPFLVVVTGLAACLLRMICCQCTLSAQRRRGQAGTAAARAAQHDMERALLEAEEQAALEAESTSAEEWSDDAVDDSQDEGAGEGRTRVPYVPPVVRSSRSSRTRSAVSAVDTGVEGGEEADAEADDVEERGVAARAARESEAGINNGEGAEAEEAAEEADADEVDAQTAARAARAAEVRQARETRARARARGGGGGGGEGEEMTTLNCR